MLTSYTSTEIQHLQVKLKNGSVIQLPVGQATETVKQQPDEIKDYSHYALQVEIIFILFLGLIKVLDKEKLLPICKMMMLQLRGRNPQAKYPSEILRMLPLREACQVLQACFVDTRGN